MVSMLPYGRAKEILSDVKPPKTYSFVQKDCKTEQSGFGKLKCMMEQTKRAFQLVGPKPDFSKLVMSEEQAAKMQLNMKRLHAGLQLLQSMGTTQEQKHLALEQGRASLRAGEDMGLDPDWAYITEKDSKPIDGPLNSSLIEPPSLNKF